MGGAAGGAVGDDAPNPNNGHCIPAVGYDADQLLIVTWGELKSMAWDFYDAYADEAFAVLSQDFIEKSGVSPQGLNLQALRPTWPSFDPTYTTARPRRPA